MDAVPACRVALDGSPLEGEAQARLTSVAVDLHVDLFARCALTFHDPETSLEFRSGARVQVRIGRDEVFAGEVVALEPRFVRDRPPMLAVICLEELHRLALCQMTRAFNDADDAEVVKRIAQEHGLSSEAPAGTRGHRLQSNVTDAAFLRRVAQSHGNHVRLCGKKLVVAPPPRGEEIALGPADGVRKLRVKLSAAQAVGDVTVHGWDAAAKREIVGKASGGPGTAALAVAGHQPQPADVSTAEAMARGRLRKISEGTARASGEIIGNARIVPGAVLAMDGVAKQLDGSYRVEEARHRWSRNGYLVKFEAVRTAKRKAKAAAPVEAAPPYDPELPPDESPKGPPRLYAPQWSQRSYGHGEVADVQVKAENLEGQGIRFVAEQHAGAARWEPVGEAVVKVEGGRARAQVELRKKAQLAQPRWSATRHQHGATAQLQVAAPGVPDGARVRFVLEHHVPGSAAWAAFRTLEVDVRGGKAVASVVLEHPARTGGDDFRDHKVRFRAELVEAHHTRRSLRFRAERLQGES